MKSTPTHDFQLSGAAHAFGSISRNSGDGEALVTSNERENEEKRSSACDIGHIGEVLMIFFLIIFFFKFVFMSRVVSHQSSLVMRG